MREGSKSHKFRFKGLPCLCDTVRLSWHEAVSRRRSIARQVATVCQWVSLARLPACLAGSYVYTPAIAAAERARECIPVAAASSSFGERFRDLRAADRAKAACVPAAATAAAAAARYPHDGVAREIDKRRLQLYGGGLAWVDGLRRESPRLLTRDGELSPGRISTARRARGSNLSRNNPATKFNGGTDRRTRPRK